MSSACREGEGAQGSCCRPGRWSDVRWPGVEQCVLAGRAQRTVGEGARLQAYPGRPIAGTKRKQLRRALLHMCLAPLCKESSSALPCVGGLRCLRCQQNKVH